MSDRLVDKFCVMARFCDQMAAFSTCKRLSNGSIILPRDMSAVLAVGYNGQPRAAPNDGCSGEPGACGCVHAEANALLKLRAPREDFGFILYTKLSPCRHCCGLIANDGRVGLVLYRDEYRDATGLANLSRAGVKFCSLRGLSEEQLGLLLRGVYE